MKREEVDTLIVGAGPSGLLHAIGLLQKNPQKQILILEKREEYTRNHVVRFKYSKLEEYIKTIGGENIPELTDLVKRLKKNPAIRINELEGILKKAALRMGAEIEYDEVKDVQSQVFEKYPNLDLLIGSDGTHSTVSKQVFGEDNQIKHSFDYVLQVRFEVTGPKPNAIDLPSWPSYLQAYGVAGEEVMGKTVDGKTPITMQIMISKEDFDALTPHATSKTPIRPFNDAETKLDKVPDEIMQKVKGYLGLRLAHYTNNNAGEHIDMSDVRLSVNEAPATRAKSVLTYKEVGERKVTVMLAGDAALGLSYFKGVDACLENASHALNALNTDSPEQRIEQLEEYSEWFDKDLAPRKVNEVAQYSKYGARLPVAIFAFLNRLLGRDFAMNTAQAERFADLYHGNQREVQKNGASQDILNTPYPHRSNYFMSVLNTTPTPVSEHMKTIGKHFQKFFTTYKSNNYLYKDLLQPLNAVKNIIEGALKIGLSPLMFLIATPINLFSTRKLKTGWEQVKSSFAATVGRMGDGFGQLGVGITLALTAVLMPIKVVVNSITTARAEPRKIENNPGMAKLIKEAEKVDHEEMSVNKMNALRIDMHRKLEKSLDRHQKTDISVEEERKAYKACQPSNPESYKQYFKLFKPAPQTPIEGSKAANDAAIDPTETTLGK
ncbi:hypothetical protein [Legionella genomosp. 1]|uniref:hypothetical protein n=1 Tax=Legionella genomosp. 1 TaxID=1093625 RepID=UPI0010568EEF|nr:hypothetical protein [Legionella genomosp. 1]